MNLSNGIPNAVKDMELSEKTFGRSFFLYLLHPVLLSSGRGNRVTVMYIKQFRLEIKNLHFNIICL